MKRHVCTVAAALALALVGASPALATGLPGLGEVTQSATQSTSFGDQTIGEQRNDADVTQKQGNGNVNVSPAIALFGDASTENEQGNDNKAEADVDQSNSATQTQSSEQRQSLDGADGSCCDGQSQAGEQKVYGGDQDVGRQKNDADVTQYQGNGNVNVSPAIALFGDASTENEQGNGNTAEADVDQSNDARQSQTASQNQSLDGSGGYCCDGQSQAGEQKIRFGDQDVGKQSNEADVTQKQGNGNVNVSPAIALFGDASTTNEQGNDNWAKADVDQSNSARQSQTASQRHSLEQDGGCCEKHSSKCDDGCGGKRDSCKKDRCDGGQSQAGEQKVYGGDQYVGKQRNDADVRQKQGNGNVNVSPAIALGFPGHDGCKSPCSSSKGGKHGSHGGGDASTSNSQGNGNRAYADVNQSNRAEQTQRAEQHQELDQHGGACCEPSHGCKPPCSSEHKGCKSDSCGSGRDQSGEQRFSGGNQSVEKQKNEADVTQKQGNGNVNVSPALAFAFPKHDGCKSSCSGSYGKKGGKQHPATSGDASTRNSQGNDNWAKADVDQSNRVYQSQVASQKQSLLQACKEVME